MSALKELKVFLNSRAPSDHVATRRVLLQLLQHLIDTETKNQETIGE